MLNSRDQLDIYSPDAYRSGPPHEALAHLRRTDPVHWQDVPGQAGYWAVLRHSDVVEVARQPLLFSAQVGGVTIEDASPESLARMKRMLLAMDPPDHGHYRRPVAARFRAKVIAALEGQIRSVVAEILDEAAGAGEVDFVPDVAAKVPSRVFGQIMGLPPADVDRLHHLAEAVTSSQDPEFQFQGDTPAETAAGPAGAMALYAMNFVAERRSLPDPPEDLTTLLLETDFRGRPMDDATFASFFVQMVTAGNDTTKTLLSSGLLTLLEHPEDLAAVRSNPALWPDTIEEMLRYDNPLHYFRRTATRDSILGGRHIAAGDKVVMLYTSANRDESVFDEPDRFIIRRRPNPHLSFGIAEHFCLGAHLARLEAKVFFEELSRRFKRIEHTADPVRVRSNLNNAFRSVPLRLLAA